MSPAIEHAFIELADKHRKIADLYELISKELQTGKAEDKPERAAKKAEKEAKKAEKAKEPEATPEQIAADLKTNLVALVTKDRAKATAILAAIGARKFSEITPDKHASILAQLKEALNASAEVDPLS